MLQTVQQILFGRRAWILKAPKSPKIRGATSDGSKPVAPRCCDDPFVLNPCAAIPKIPPTVLLVLARQSAAGATGLHPMRLQHFPQRQIHARMAAVRRRPSFRRLVVGVALLSIDSSGASGAVSIESLPFESGHAGKASTGEGRGAERWCGVGELLPQATETELSSEWSTEYVIEPPYGCNCASIKSR